MAETDYIKIKLLEIDRPVSELGSVTKIIAIFNMDNPDTVKITIKNPSASTAIDAVSMTAEKPNVYSYLYQSATTDIEGIYKIIIDATHIVGGTTYTCRSIDEFTLTDKDE